MRAATSGPNGLADNKSDKIVGRVIAARSLSGEDVRPDGDVVAVADNLMLKQAFMIEPSC